MNAFWKAVADAILKKPVDNLVAELKANRDANIAAIEAESQALGGNVVTAATNFFAAKVKAPNALVSTVEELVIPEAESLLSAAIGAAGNDVPAAYDAGLAYLEKVDSEL